MSQFLCWLLLAAVCTAQARDKTGCPSVFQQKCTCSNAMYYNEEKKIVNCTDAGFKNADMLGLLPVDTQVLIFTGNDVKEIPPNVFGSEEEYEQLEVIDMTNNKIRHIRGQAFHRIPNVHRLLLNHNDLYINGSHEHPRIFANMFNLKELHLTNAFTEYVDSKKYLVNLENIFYGSNLSKLEKLHLEQNEIWMVPNGDMFCQLPALLDLYLGDNKLSSFDVKLDCLNHLRYVDLESNKFTTFPNSILRRFDAANERLRSTANGPAFTVNLKDNFFICDCKITDFRDWLKASNIIGPVEVRDKQYMTCKDGTPSSNIGKKITDVEEAFCETSSETEGKSDSDATAIVVVLLVIIMSTLTAGIIYMNIAWVRTKTTDFVFLIKKRGAYTSLVTKPEEPEVDV